MVENGIIAFFEATQINIALNRNIQYSCAHILHITLANHLLLKDKIGSKKKTYNIEFNYRN